MLLYWSVLSGCREASSIWEGGDTFQVATRYADLASPLGRGEAWSDEVVWTFQVLESGLVPDGTDPLARFADGEPLDVLKAEPEPAIEPAVWLVFRRGKLVAAASSAGAWSSARGDLSRAMLTGVPMPGTFGESEYTDVLGGGLVRSRYDAGAPWPTWTESDAMQARLVQEVRVPARREVPDDFDWREALRASVDLDSASRVDGGFAAVAVAEPWAGSWWPFADAPLVFGYGAPTLSDRIRAEVDTRKQSLDALTVRIRELPEGAGKIAAQRRFDREQAALEQAVRAFYDGVVADLDQQRLVVRDGWLVSVEGWSYRVDDLSPMDKLALVGWTRGDLEPFAMPAWEIAHHFSPYGPAWWGHCNGWAGASILTNEPVAPVTSGGVTFSPADIKGLLTEAHATTFSRFYGARYYSEEDDISDLTPAAFHRLIGFYLRDQGVPLVFDLAADEEVWNQPAYAADVSVVEVADRTFDVTATVTFTSDGVAEDWVDGDTPESFDEVWHYRLTTDADGFVVDGQWENPADHPDFAWVPYGNTPLASSSGAENPYLVYGDLLDVVGDVER